MPTNDISIQNFINSHRADERSYTDASLAALRTAAEEQYRLISATFVTEFFDWDSTTPASTGTAHNGMRLPMSIQSADSTYNRTARLDKVRLPKRPRARLPVGLICWMKSSGTRTNHYIASVRIVEVLRGGKYKVQRVDAQDPIGEPISGSMLFVQPIDLILWQGITRSTPEQARSFFSPDSFTAPSRELPGSELELQHNRLLLCAQRRKCTDRTKRISTYMFGLLLQWYWHKRLVTQTLTNTNNTENAYTSTISFPGTIKSITGFAFHSGIAYNNTVSVTERDASLGFTAPSRHAADLTARMSKYTLLLQARERHVLSLRSDCYGAYASGIYPRGSHNFRDGVQRISALLGNKLTRALAPMRYNASQEAEFAANYRKAVAQDHNLGKCVAKYLRLLPKNPDHYNAESFFRAVTFNASFYELPQPADTSRLVNVLLAARPYAGWLSTVRIGRDDGFRSRYVLLPESYAVDIYTDRLSSYSAHPLHADALILLGLAMRITWQGQERVYMRSALYEHDDGSFLPVRPGPVIGGYHSSRNVLGKLIGSDDRGPYLGMELEIEVVNGSDREACARRLLAIANSPPFSSSYKYCAAEGDGSLTHGFEIVTGYGSLSVHEPRLRAMFEDNKWGASLKSHDTTTCGLHVHICKREMTLLHAVKMTRFAHATVNAQFIKDIARRYGGGRYAAAHPDKKASPEVMQSARDYRRYSGRNKLSRTEELSAMRHINASRYELLNYHNEKTVEFRMFRGSLKFGTIMAALEFTLALYRFTKQAGVRDLTADKFCEWVSQPGNRADTVHLRALLSRKGWTVYQPKRKALHSTDSAAAA